VVLELVVHHAVESLSLHLLLLFPKIDPREKGVAIGICSPFEECNLKLVIGFL
jgi:hypothetical protein